MSATGSGTSGFGSGFVQPMGEDGLGMRCGPVVGQHLLQPWVVRMQTEEEFPYVAPRLDPMTLRTGQDRAQRRLPTACHHGQDGRLLATVAFSHTPPALLLGGGRILRSLAPGRLTSQVLQP
jgi:hypothetical protein